MCKLTYKEWKIQIKTWQRDIEGERKKERERERRSYRQEMNRVKQRLS